jgi:hypothetical protein
MMWLNRVTPDPFENSKLETSAMGQEANRLKINGDSLLAKFDRFGNGARRSDFEVEISWNDIEEFISQFRTAGHQSAVELDNVSRCAPDGRLAATRNFKLRHSPPQSN